MNELKEAIELMETSFKCTKCGACCRELVICITYSDIKRWVKQNRTDILRQVTFTRGAPQGDGFYFEQTITAPKKPCLFLIDDQCSIHETKPVCCKDAPDSLTKFDVCPVWDSSYINKNLLKKIKTKQDKDFKKCVINFKELLEVTIKARGCQLKVNM
jgi:Fe-S-cluster containining protein